MRSSADRQRAARLLIRVEDGAYSSRLLAERASAAVTARVLGVLRWQIALDAVLSGHLRRPMKQLDPAVRAALRIGLFEAAVLGVPREVATDGAVHLTRRLAVSSASGLVNAVLRRAIPDWESTVTEGPPDLRLSHPRWLADRWRANFGDGAAELAMAADQEPAELWAWWLDEPRDEPASLVRHPWCPGAWSLPGASADVVAAAVAGRAYIQDPSSQLVAHVANALAGSDGDGVDVCAAPGGKAALWRRLSGRPPDMAVDRNLMRARLMKPLLDRAGPVPVVAADARRPPFRPALWSLVSVDAPCTGTGTLRRHPEIKWRLRDHHITELARLQEEMLVGALDLLRPGGIVLYSTCSVEPEENEAHFVSGPADFESVDLGSVLPNGVPWLPTSAAGVRILPNAHGDGFTLHAIRRRA